MTIDSLPAVRFRRLTPLAFAFAGLLASLGEAAPASPPQQKVPFEELGQEFLKAQFGRKALPEETSLESLLETHYAHARLGSYDVALPTRFLKDKELVTTFTQVSAGVVSLQGRLVDWLRPEPATREALQADLATLRAWVEDWKTAKLSRLKEDLDLYSALEAPTAVLEARDRLRAALSEPTQLGVAPQYVDGVTLVLCPTRRDFMEMVGFIGLTNPPWRAENWIDGVDEWTQVWKDAALVLALEYAPWTGYDPNFATGLPASRLDKDGLMQHALNQAGRALVFRWFNRPAMVAFERALVGELVIDELGRIMVLDGEGGISTSGGQTAPYERFVPGGNSAGGVLPPISAAPMDALMAGRWREGKGADHFLGALRRGQQDGAKRAVKDRDNPKRKDDTANFEIDSDRTGAKHVVSAPFLGSWGAEQIYPPPEFLNDYRQFFKSYQTGFLHWLRSQGVDETDEARAEHFAAFLRALGSQATPCSLDEAFEQAYGMPLSSSDSGTDCLEWRFLRWLSEST